MEQFALCAAAVLMAVSAATHEAGAIIWNTILRTLKGIVRNICFSCHTAAFPLSNEI